MKYLFLEIVFSNSFEIIEKYQLPLDCSFQDFLSALNVDESLLSKLSLQYKDSDGDMITLAAQGDWEEAKAESRHLEHSEDRILRLTIDRNAWVEFESQLNKESIATVDDDDVEGGFTVVPPYPFPKEMAPTYTESTFDTQSQPSTKSTIRTTYYYPPNQCYSYPPSLDSTTTPFDGTQKEIGTENGKGKGKENENENENENEKRQNDSSSMEQLYPFFAFLLFETASTHENLEEKYKAFIQSEVYRKCTPKTENTAIDEDDIDLALLNFSDSFLWALLKSKKISEENFAFIFEKVNQCLPISFTDSSSSSSSSSSNSTTLTTNNKELERPVLNYPPIPCYPPVLNYPPIPCYPPNFVSQPSVLNYPPIPCYPPNYVVENNNSHKTDTKTLSYPPLPCYPPLEVPASMYPPLPSYSVTDPSKREKHDYEYEYDSSYGYGYGYAYDKLNQDEEGGEQKEDQEEEFEEPEDDEEEEVLVTYSISDTVLEYPPIPSYPKALAEPNSDSTFI